jgi:predicted transport protein
LRRLENHDRKERVPVDEYTIEHILPQNPDLSPAWKQALGADWQRIQEQWLHTLGNLTLTGYNAEYSDRPFAEKRDMTGGFKQSPLKLNAGLGQLDAWHEPAIRERAERLASQALTVWVAPKLSAATMASYQPEKAPATSSYTIDDHPHLLTPGLREVFEAFRKEVLALDPCVSEEFYKPYVAYKAETNFVDVVSQAKRMKLTLNMPFAEINDPKQLCRDVTNVGHYGNGDVEVSLKSLDELPHVMGLVRQSYERQMGDGGQA